MNIKISPWQLELLKKKRPAKMVYYPWKHQGWFDKSKLVIVDDVETPQPMTPSQKEQLLKWYREERNQEIPDAPKDTLAEALLDGKTRTSEWFDADAWYKKYGGGPRPMAVNPVFYKSLAKEFDIALEKLKGATIALRPDETPTITLTIELTASQTNALHWIDEAGD